MGENDTKTISVDANRFENGAKQHRFHLKLRLKRCSVDGVFKASNFTCAEFNAYIFYDLFSLFWPSCNATSTLPKHEVYLLLFAGRLGFGEGMFLFLPFAFFVSVQRDENNLFDVKNDDARI